MFSGLERIWVQRSFHSIKSSIQLAPFLSNRFSLKLEIECTLVSLCFLRTKNFFDGCIKSKEIPMKDGDQGRGNTLSLMFNRILKIFFFLFLGKSCEICDLC